jgi:excisionase family DNA binding protein
MDAVEPSDVYLLRPAEVVELLGVSRSWLYDAANAGRIPCVRLGSPDGPVRFRLRELKTWIDQGRVIPLEERRAGGRPSAQGGARARRRLRGCRRRSRQSAAAAACGRIGRPGRDVAALIVRSVRSTASRT